MNGLFNSLQKSISVSVSIIVGSHICLIPASLIPHFSLVISTRQTNAYVRISMEYTRIYTRILSTYTRILLLYYNNIRVYSNNIRVYYILSSNKGIFVSPIWPEVNCPHFHTPGRSFLYRGPYWPGPKWASTSSQANMGVSFLDVGSM
jgi:hypothetical protein